MNKRDMNNDSYQNSLKEIANELIDLAIKKRQDYGTNNILKSPVGPELGIVVRVGDKLNRLANLYQNNKEPTNEPVDDSWKDIAIYSILALMVRRGKFELPLE